MTATAGDPELPSVRKGSCDDEATIWSSAGKKVEQDICGLLTEVPWSHRSKKETRFLGLIDLI